MHKKLLLSAVAFLVIGFFFAIADIGGSCLTIAHETGGLISFYWDRGFDFPTGEALWVDVPAVAIFAFLVAAAFLGAPVLSVRTSADVRV